MMELRELTLLSVPVRLLAVVIASGIIGLERGLKNRAAGFRTYMLVSIGACMIMMINQYAYQFYGVGDPVRMGAQVVSGIGFLGAGSILVTKHNQIKGLTTAAGLWASACIGLAFGIGFYEAAIIGAVAVYLSLTVFHAWEDFMRRNTKVISIYVELKDNFTMADFLKKTRELELSLSNVQMEPSQNAVDHTVSFLASVKGAGKQGHQQLMDKLRGIECIGYLEEL